MAHSPQQNLLHRLWIYQSERFPLFRTAFILAIFSSASVCASAHMGSRSLPELKAYLVAFMVTLILFFQLRACDEVKDLEDDRRFRPERAIPRGLVPLKLIIGIAAGLTVVAAVITGIYRSILLIPLFMVWTWLALMAMEFFVPEWLKARPLAYLVSHMLIMPLIDFFITACEWLPYGFAPPPGVWLFLALSFANGCVFEFGRKLYAPENERTGVETYSAVYGVRNAALMWSGCVFTAYILLILIAYVMGSLTVVLPLGSIVMFIALGFSYTYIKTPTPKMQKIMDDISGCWVFACYSLAGYAPFLMKVISQ